MDIDFVIFKEVDIGLAADVGTLNRLPKIVGNEGLVRELAYTARIFDADQALNHGLQFVSQLLMALCEIHCTQTILE